MIISKIAVRNWRNFQEAESNLRVVTYVIGPNASGKSNFLDVFRFLRDLAKSDGGGLQKAISRRGGMSKVRCLHARKRPEVSITVELADSAEDAQPSWVYELAFDAEKSGRHRVIVKKERVTRIENDKPLKVVLDRPDQHDREDGERLTQTALEQVQANGPFRDLAEQLARVTYLHIVPQLLKFTDEIGGRRLEDDPFGQDFLERIARTKEKFRTGRLGRIQNALRKVIPSFENLSFVQDAVTGRPHLQIKYKHHRPQGAFQREDQFSDGTLRLIALLWLLQDGDSLLLLEEPELSLNLQVVEKIPQLIEQVKKLLKKTRQIIITTHSEALLSNKGIDGRSVVVLVPSEDGTKITGPTTSDLEGMRAGFSPAETMLPKAQRLKAGQMELAL